MLDPMSLPDGNASLALNCRLESGALRPLWGMRRVYRLAKPGQMLSLYRWGAEAGADREGYVMGLTAAAVPVVLSPNHGLQTGERVYLAGVNLGNHPVNDREYPVDRIDAHRFSLRNVNGGTWPAFKYEGYWTKLNGYWFHWDTIVQAVRGPIGGDTTERTFITGDGKPKITYAPIAIQGGGDRYPLNTYDLGVPPPTESPEVEIINPQGQISNVIRGNPVVISAIEHGLQSGLYVLLTGVQGTTELNGNIYRVSVIGPNQFQLRNSANNAAIDGGNYGVYVSGGRWELDVTKVSPADKETRFYAYNYVSALQEEGPPSLPSRGLQVSPGQDVRVSGMQSGPITGSLNLNAKRLFRSSDGPQGTYMQVIQLGLGIQTYIDQRGSGSLVTVLQSIDNDPPPPGLRHILALPSGGAAGIQRNQLCFSKPGLLHAWPPLWRKNANYPFVGIGNFGNTVVAMTESQVYMADGTDPGRVTLRDLKLNQGCVSQRSIVSLGGYGVAYASPDGLVLIGPSMQEIITKGTLTKEQWQALRPESMHAYLYDGMYICFYRALGGEEAGFIFDPQPNGIGFMRINVYAHGGWVDPLSDALYLIIGQYVEKWDSLERSPLNMRWRSKLYDTGIPVNFSAAEVMAERYRNVTFRLDAESEQVHTESVRDEEPFRMNDDFFKRQFQYELSGTDRIRKLAIAEDMDDLNG